jgi:hypothetical protein
MSYKLFTCMERILALLCALLLLADIIIGIMWAVH